MIDDRIFDAFPAALGERVDPDAAFGDALYEALATDLGFRTSTAAGRRTLAERLARALGLDRAFPVSPEWRLASLATLGALLLATLLAIVLIAGQLLRSTTPIVSGDDIVARSQALYTNPPAFDMTVRLAGRSVIRYRYDGKHDLRADVIAGSFSVSPEGPGSFRIDTATQTATYDAAKKSWTQANVPAPQPPLFSMLDLNWIVFGQGFKPSETPPVYDCPDGWQREADGVVANRPAYHVSCVSGGDFWIDQQSFLLDGSGSLIAASSLTVGPSLDPSLFAMAMPAGAYDANNPPPSTVLAVGRPAQDWTGPLQGGGSFDSTSLRGLPAAIYFWAEWCDPCLHESLDSFAKAARVGHPGIGFVSVATGTANEGALQAAIEASGSGFAVVRDDGGSIVTDWGLTGVPALVLLRPDGTVASVTVGPVTSADLEAMLAALIDGAPIPTLVPGSPGPGCGCPASPGASPGR